VLWGDHGWKLGEYGDWCKHTTMELDTHVPLFFSAPGFKQDLRTNSLAEYVDIYPTLCELAGLKLPEHLEGQSLVPILKNPEVAVNEVAISQWPKGKRLGYDRKSEMMGYSIKSGKYRYTRWQMYENPDSVVARELYDHTHSDLATRNLAEDKNYGTEVKNLDALMTRELSNYKLLRSHPEN